MNTNKSRIALLLLSLGLAACGGSSSNNGVAENTATPAGNNETVASIENLNLEFVAVPGDGDLISDFEISATEVSNADYAQFLTEAYAKGSIRYDASSGIIYDSSGVKMTDLNGHRVIKNHNYVEGACTKDMMENPLNRNFIAFDATQAVFYVVDPADVDWDIYFDESRYPGICDVRSDWAEVGNNSNGFAGEGDSDGLMPTLDEVKTWPANFITYYGARAFADHFGLRIPTLSEWRQAAAGGHNFAYATSDGSHNEGIAWFNSAGIAETHKGHVQPVASKGANPYGIYNMGGNVWEWVEDWYDGTEVFGAPGSKKTEDFFIDPNISWDQAHGNYLKGLIGGSFNFFAATMSLTHNHAANANTGNDHFGFRVAR